MIIQAERAERPSRRREVDSTLVAEAVSTSVIPTKAPWSVRAESMGASITEAISSAASERPVVLAVVAVFVIELVAVLIRL